MQYITSQTLFRLRVILIAGTIAILGIVFVDIFLNNSGGVAGRGAKKTDVRQEDLKVADEILHARLWQLQDMDQQFASLLSRQFDQNALQKTNASIQTAEAALKKSIDSLTEVGLAYDEAMGTNDFQNMTTFFQKILENRRFIAFTRMGVISGDGSPNEKQTILKLQNELYEKDKLIAAAATDKTVISLQNQLGEKDKKIFALETQLQKEEAEKQGYVQSTQKLQSDLAEKDKIITSLGNRNTGPDQKAILDLQKELSAKNKQINDLQTQAQSNTQTVQRLQSELGEKNKLLADANKKQPSDQRALAALQNELTQKNTQITNLQRQVQTEKQNYTQSVQKLQSDLTEKNRLLADANRKLPADQKSLATLQNEVSTKNKQLSDLQNQLQRELAEKKANAQKFQNDLAQKNKMIDALSNIKIPTDDKAVASLQREVRAKDKQITDLELQVEQLSTTVASSAKAPADQRGLTALQNELSTKNKQISTLQAELRKEQLEKQGFSKTINDLQLELIEKNKVIASNGSSIARPAVSNGENSRDLTNLRLAYNNTMTQLGVLQKKYNLLKAEMDQIKGQR